MHLKCFGVENLTLSRGIAVENNSKMHEVTYLLKLSKAIAENENIMRKEVCRI